MDDITRMFDSIAPAPCDYPRQCEHYDRCAEKRLACQKFCDYANTGRWDHDDETPPNRSYFIAADKDKNISRDKQRAANKNRRNLQQWLRAGGEADARRD